LESTGALGFVPLFGTGVPVGFGCADSVGPVGRFTTTIWLGALTLSVGGAEVGGVVAGAGLAFGVTAGTLAGGVGDGASATSGVCPERGVPGVDLGGWGGWKRRGIEMVVEPCEPVRGWIGEMAAFGASDASGCDRPGDAFCFTAPVAASVRPPLPLRITRLPAGMVTVAPRATDTVPSRPMVAPGIVIACEMTVCTTFPDGLFVATIVLTCSCAVCDVLLLSDTRVAVMRPARTAADTSANDLIRIPTSVGVTISIVRFATSPTGQHRCGDHDELVLRGEHVLLGAR